MNTIIYIYEENVLTLAELEATTCLGTTGLLTLYLTAVASHEAFGTECLLVLGIDLNQCAGDSQTQSLALAGVTATLQVNLDIILLCYVQQVQGLLYYELQNGAGEVLGQVTLVDGDLTATFLNVYAGYGTFAAAQCIYYCHLLVYL